MNLINWLPSMGPHDLLRFKNLLEKFLELKKAVFYWLLLAIIR